jgi:hypothetical protein
VKIIQRASINQHVTPAMIEKLNSPKFSRQIIYATVFVLHSRNPPDKLRYREILKQCRIRYPDLSVLLCSSILQRFPELYHENSSPGIGELAALPEILLMLRQRYQMLIWRKIADISTSSYPYEYSIALKQTTLHISLHISGIMAARAEAIRGSD